MWNDKYLGPMESNDVVSNAITLRPHAAVAARTDDARGCESDVTDDSDEDPEKEWEWRRLYLSANGDLKDLLCCPEDVLQTDQCDHKNSASVEEHMSSADAVACLSVHNAMSL